MNRTNELNSFIQLAVSKYSKTVARTAFSYLKNTSDAEGITQEVFLLLLQSNMKFEEEEHLKAWLIRGAINTQGECKMKKFNKRKLRVSAATAACAVIMISGVTYAAVMNFKNVSHNDYGLNVSNNHSESTLTKGDSEFKDTADQRERMDKEDSGYKLISEEIGNKNDKWSKRTVWEDTTPTYISEDTKNWEVDENNPVGIKVKYAYDNYEDAAKDANMPNIMNKLQTQVKSSTETYYEEYKIEGNENLTRQQINGVFEFKKGKVYTELAKDLSGEAGVSVITGIDKPTNEREYESKAGVIYKLSDNKNDNITKTTTLVSTGDFTLIVQFENLSDDEIHTILENLDLIQLEKQ